MYKRQDLYMGMTRLDGIVITSSSAISMPSSLSKETCILVVRAMMQESLDPTVDLPDLFMGLSIYV